MGKVCISFRSVTFDGWCSQRQGNDFGGHIGGHLEVKCVKNSEKR